jgi:uncharacterized protein YcaQ
MTIFKQVLLDYRIVEGKGFVTIDRKIADLLFGFPYRVKWYPLTEQRKHFYGVDQVVKTFTNKLAATNHIKNELANIDEVLDKIKKEKK